MSSHLVDQLSPMVIARSHGGQSLHGASPVSARLDRLPALHRRIDQSGWIWPDLL